MEQMPMTVCPKCNGTASIENVLTAQSNQNVIFTCPYCFYEVKDIETDKG
jgi:hypothetical protein